MTPVDVFQTAERIHAHRSILALGSEPFYNMLYGDMKEQAEIRIPDATPAAFRILLRLVANHIAGTHVARGYPSPFPFIYHIPSFRPPPVRTVFHSDWNAIENGTA